LTRTKEEHLLRSVHPERLIEGASAGLGHRQSVTRDQLTTAHRKVGRMVKDIAAELGKKR